MGRETFIAPVTWEREPFEWKENKDLWPVVAPKTGRVEILNEVVFSGTYSDAMEWVGKNVIECSQPVVVKKSQQ